jgi:hypothetical protein
MLDDSLQEVGLGRSVVTDKNGVIIAGNKTAERAIDRGFDEAIVVHTQGDKLVVVQRDDLDLVNDDDKQTARNLAFFDNRVAEVDLNWIPEQIEADRANGVEIVDKLWSPVELDILGVGNDGEINETIARSTLAEQFIVPPFTVLDARQGYWQTRKRAWVALGLKGELGRGENIGAIPPNEETRLSPRYKGKEAATSYSSQQALNAMQHGKRDSAKVFGTEGNIAPMVKGQAKINSAFGSSEGAGGAQSQTGTSIFDPVLCEIAYRWFCPLDGIVVNPTAGESVYGIVAGYLGYDYKGVELRQEQIDSNIEQAINIGVDDRCQWVQGNGVDVCNLLGVDIADFIMCCPPYYDLEIYSDLDDDLSNLQTYEEFLEMYRLIISESVRALKDNRFAMFTVGDVRDKRGHYRNFVSDTIQAFLDAGMQLYNEAILVTAIGSLPIRVSAQFPKGRKLGKAHQNVLIFIKGDWRQAVADCGHVEVYTPDGFGEDNNG